MLDNAHRRFLQALALVEAHLTGRRHRHEVLVSSIAADWPVQAFKSFVLDNRKDDAVLGYSTCIVQMYGAFEKLIEGVVEEYVEMLSDIIPRYEQLPDQIRKLHVDLSADLLKARSLRKYQDRVDETAVVRNLLACVHGSTSYRLNSMAFTQHSFNLRPDAVGTMFTNVGASGVLGDVRRNEKFAAVAAARAGVRTLSNAPDTVVFQDIEQLIERRNDIAHGEPADILSDAEIASVCAYLRSFGDALTEAVRHRTLDLEIRWRGSVMPTPIRVYDRRIVCFPSTPVCVSVGSRLAAVSGEKRCFAGRVLEIQVDGEAKEQVPQGGQAAFAVRVDFPAKQNWTYYFLAPS